MQARGYAAHDESGVLSPYNFTRREPVETDVVIKIRWSGICHSDLHTAKGDWGKAIYPLVPGHEIIGYVESVGPNVTKFKVGDKVGVGCFVDSCRNCENCHSKEEQFCLKGMTGTYNSMDKYGKPTAGGYSNIIVVDQDYVLRVPDSLDFSAAAPLLCAGITTYSPLRHWNVKEGSRVGVAGLGGLGHMAVKIAAAMGAEVTVISTSEKKRADADRLGATKFMLVSESESYANYFDLIIDTISAPHDVQFYVNLLRKDGTICLVGLPTEPMKLTAFPLVLGRRSVAGSLIGGIKETQEMLDFCGKHNIVSDVEIVEPKDLNVAWDRLLKNDVKYRFVLDMEKL